MLKQTEAQIFLGSQRGITQSEGFQNMHTLNFESYQAYGREAFGGMLVFNEIMLAAGKSVNITTIKPTEIVLFPIVGGLELLDRHGESFFVNSGESFRFLAFPERSFKVFNPYPLETINYLEIHLTPDLSDEAMYNHIGDNPLNVFSLSDQNKLIHSFSGLGGKITGYLGKYAGRKEGEYLPVKVGNGIFTYVIQGAFEVQNRLLEKGDALSLLHAEALEFEALSNEAIILVVEVAMG